MVDFKAALTNFSARGTSHVESESFDSVVQITGDSINKEDDYLITVDPLPDNAVTPEEKKNPLGYSVGPLSVVILILQGVVGTGIFSTPGSILKSMHGVYWFNIRAMDLLFFFTSFQCVFIH